MSKDTNIWTYTGVVTEVQHSEDTYVSVSHGNPASPYSQSRVDVATTHRQHVFVECHDGSHHQFELTNTSLGFARGHSATFCFAAKPNWRQGWLAQATNHSTNRWSALDTYFAARFPGDWLMSVGAVCAGIVAFLWIIVSKAQRFNGYGAKMLTDSDYIGAFLVAAIVGLGPVVYLAMRRSQHRLDVQMACTRLTELSFKERANVNNAHPAFVAGSTPALTAGAA